LGWGGRSETPGKKRRGGGGGPYQALVKTYFSSAERKANSSWALPLRGGGEEKREGKGGRKKDASRQLHLCSSHSITPKKEEKERGKGKHHFSAIAAYPTKGEGEKEKGKKKGGKKSKTVKKEEGGEAEKGTPSFLLFKDPVTKKKSKSIAKERKFTPPSLFSLQKEDRRGRKEEGSWGHPYLPCPLLTRGGRGGNRKGGGGKE